MNVRGYFTCDHVPSPRKAARMLVPWPHAHVAPTNIMEAVRVLCALDEPLWLTLRGGEHFIGIQWAGVADRVQLMRIATASVEWIVLENGKAA